MRNFLEKASKAYYEGKPIISDIEFDMLAKKYNFDDVGYQVTDGVPHHFRMYSLQKFFNIAESPVVDDKDYYMVSPKLDGAAVSLLYVNGELELGLTRGDGTVGKDITEKMRCLVPSKVYPNFDSIIQITGEVVAPKSIPNARNYAAGALNLKVIEDFLEREVDFIAYDLQANTSTVSTWSGAMTFLENEGFRTVSSLPENHNFPTDGKVYRVNSYQRFSSMGYTSHHPRGAFALKEQQKGVESTLRKVEWQVGKSGVVSPVGIIDPIEIGDATITRATLHNIEYIRSLNLEIGCRVEVIRSGEIIPRILRRVDD